MSLFPDDIIYYIENPKDSTKSTHTTIRFNKGILWKSEYGCWEEVRLQDSVWMRQQKERVRTYREYLFVNKGQLYFKGLVVTASPSYPAQGASTAAETSPTASAAKTTPSWREEWLWSEAKPYLQLERPRIPPRTLEPRGPGTSCLSSAPVNTETPAFLAAGA